MLPQILPEFISEPERQFLLEWAYSMRPFLKSNGPGRHYCQLDLLPYVPELCHQLRAVVADALGLKGAVIEPIFRSYLSIIAPGGQIHPHTDRAAPGCRHLRCNLFLELPASGGLPVVDEAAYAVAARSLLYFTPDRHVHWCEKVGPGARVILSYGYLVPPADNPLIEQP